MNVSQRKIAIATGTRAEWGLLSPIAKALSARDDVSLTVLATNMHLLKEYGHTVDEIIADGFSPVEIDMGVPDGTSLGAVRGMARCMVAMAEALGRMKPDMIVILGDRYEMLATASAALMMGVPVIHIAGGEISEGAVDDSIRHAITKMSALHLTATEPYRRRVIAMGEEPVRVVNTGAIGVHNIRSVKLMGCDELSESLGFDFSKPSLLVTYHPATLDEGDVACRCAALLEALDRFPGYQVLMTYPNNDPRGRVIIDMIEAYAARNPARVNVVPSLGKRRYLSAMQWVSAVIGNSSSGIVEVPSMGVPTVDIGMRQRGRIAGPSVIHCGDSSDDIAKAIGKALSPAMQELASRRENPYSRPDTLRLIIDAIMTADPAALHVKRFHDVSLCM